MALHRRLAAAVLVLGLAAGPSWAQDAALGQRIVQQNCAACHAVGRDGPSPLPQAPLFRDLHLKYDVDDLEEALAEGIVAGHPAMRPRAFEPGEVAAIVAYLKSLEAPAPPAPASGVKPAP